MNTTPAPDLTRAYKVLALTAIATFLVSLDTSIVVVAQRTIEADLGHPTLLTWVFSAYSIAYAAGLLTAGRFADVNGRKRSFLRGLALFSIGSVLCGLAPNALSLFLLALCKHWVELNSRLHRLHWCFLSSPLKSAQLQLVSGVLLEALPLQ
jgi:MFS family permease